MIYLDWNATTPVEPETARVVQQFLCDDYGNASSRNAAGRRPMQAVREARQRIAKLLGGRPNRVLFTSGATESINTVVRAETPIRAAVLTQPTEHAAARAVIRDVESAGGRVTWLRVDQSGLIDLRELDSALTNGDATLVSVMWANNETGVVQPVAEIAEICRRSRVPFHCDATQAVGKIPVHADIADFLSFSGHKFGAPKGVGGLYVRTGRPPRGLILGGGQEGGFRGGTTNVPGIAGMGHAATLARQHVDRRDEIAARRVRFETELQARLPGTVIHGADAERLPNTSCFSVPGVVGDAFVMALGDVIVSSGSACSSHAEEVSPVLRAMGVSRKVAAAAIRVSIGPTTTDADLAIACDRFELAAKTLRSVNNS